MIVNDYKMIDRDWKKIEHCCSNTQAMLGNLSNASSLLKHAAVTRTSLMKQYVSIAESRYKQYVSNAPAVIEHGKHWFSIDAAR